MKISKNLKCVVMRNSIEIWKEAERLENLIEVLTSGKKIGFINVDNEMINSVDIVGVFSPATMEELKRRKNGQWKCEYGNWHNRGEDCQCWKKEVDKQNEKRLKEMSETGDIPEEQRMNNLKKFREMKKIIFN